MSNSIVSIFFAIVAHLCTTSNFNVNLIDGDCPQESLIHELQSFESQFVYPFSDTENFTIKHGVDGDYLAFFKSLGKPYYYVARAKQVGEIAAAVCCVLKKIPTSNGQTKEAWYICDLKIDQKYRGQHLPLDMAKTIAFWRYLQCSRGFAICMNPSDSEPKAASIFKKYGPWALDTQGLNLYTLSACQLAQNKEILKNLLTDHGYMNEQQKLCFVSTDGAKDYLITHTPSGQKRPWRLVHIQAGEGTQTYLDDNATYMICAVEGTALDNNFKMLLGAPSSTAQIVSYGMKDIDFNFLTSNQI